MTNSLVVTGKFLGAMPTESFGTNNFLVRKFFVDLTENPEYPNTPEFQLTQDKVNLVDNLVKGQLIEVKFNIEGRKFDNQQTGKKGVITNLKVWKINVINMQSAAAAPAPVAQRPAGPAAYAQPTQTPAQMAATTATGAGNQFQQENSDNDLPF